MTNIRGPHLVELPGPSGSGLGRAQEGASVSLWQQMRRRLPKALVGGGAALLLSGVALGAGAAVGLVVEQHAAIAGEPNAPLTPLN